MLTRKAVLIFLWSLILWAFGILFDVEVFFLLSGLGLSVLVLAVLLLFNAGRGLTLERQPVARVRQGEQVTLSLSLTAKEGLPQVDLLLRDICPAAQKGSEARIWVSGLQGGNSVPLTYTVTATYRGEFELGPVELICFDPLGVFRRRRLLPCAGRLLVLPRWEPLGHLPFNSRSLSSLVSGRPAPVEGDGGDFYGVREYRPGDGMRRVHWRNTARTGRPMVKQFERASHPNVLLFVDTFLDLIADADCGKVIDSMADLGLSLALKTLEVGARLGCAASGQVEPWLALSGTPLDREKVIRFFARLDLADSGAAGDGSAGLALQRVSARLGGGDTLVVLTCELEFSLVAALSGLACRGTPVVVIALEAPPPPPQKRRYFWQRNRAVVSGLEPGASFARKAQGLRALGIQVLTPLPSHSPARALMACPGGWV